jgi:hypothetical protein
MILGCLSAQEIPATLVLPIVRPFVPELTHYYRQMSSHERVEKPGPLVVLPWYRDAETLIRIEEPLLGGVPQTVSTDDSGKSKCLSGSQQSTSSFSELVISIKDEDGDQAGSQGAVLENEVLEEDEPLGEDDKVDIQQALRAAQVKTGKENKHFLPRDALDRILTPGCVSRDLAKLKDPHHHHKPLIPRERLSWYTAQVCTKFQAPSQSTSASRIKIFAILALIEKIGSIVDFIHGGISDTDLPFILTDDHESGSLRLYRKDTSGNGRIPIVAFEEPVRWPAYLLQVFDEWQWKVLVPYFHFSTAEKPRVREYHLEKNTILPFIEEDSSERKRGGFGDVWRVKIHPAHHNLSGNSVCRTYL